MITQLTPLAIFGSKPAFDEVLHVGRPNLGDRERLQARIDQMLDARWFSNDGPILREFEARIAEYLGVKHCIATCNATIALMLAMRGLGLQGEVLVPSFTFVATVHSLQWQETRPVFCDIDPLTHNLDPADVERKITPRTTGIVGVHLWGRPCDTEALEAIARKHQLKLLFDASHAFACRRGATRVGHFGDAEVFSFHATKFLNSFEGGAVVTNNNELAQKLRLMRNFGFTNYDTVEYLGMNAKMTEVCAAMGLTSLESIDEFISINRRNYLAYRHYLQGVPGVTIADYDESEGSYNFQYVILEIDADLSPLSRDELLKVLHAENVLARRYFYPGCHKMEPYATLYREEEAPLLPHTEQLSSSVLALPTGTAVGVCEIEIIASLIRTALERAAEVRSVLRG